MATRLSRRQILGIGAASLASGAARPVGAQAGSHGGIRDQPAASAPGARPYWERTYSGGPLDVVPLPPGLPGEHYRPVVVPDGATLPFRVVDGVKVFHLIAGEVDHAFDPGLRARCWGFNGRVNSTTIEAVEGERIRIYVTNRLPVLTSIHWHGLYLPNGMDGVGGLTQPYVKAGETARYEWTLRQHGTFMFHSHHDEMTQMGMGLIGMFVVVPTAFAAGNTAQANIPYDQSPLLEGVKAPAQKYASGIASGSCCSSQSMVMTQSNPRLAA